MPGFNGKNMLEQMLHDLRSNGCDVKFNYCPQSMGLYIVVKKDSKEVTTFVHDSVLSDEEVFVEKIQKLVSQLDKEE